MQKTWSRDGKVPFSPYFCIHNHLPIGKQFRRFIWYYSHKNHHRIFIRHVKFEVITIISTYYEGNLKIQAKAVTQRLSKLLINWPINKFVAWLTSWLTDSLTDSLTTWLVGWLTKWLRDWLENDLPNNQWIDLLIYWLIDDWLIDWLIKICFWMTLKMTQMTLRMT